MTRQVLLVAILGLLTTPLWAKERFIPAPGREDSAPAPAMQPATEPVARAEDLDVHLAMSFEDALNGEELPVGGPIPADNGKRDFHSVCDCNCSIPSLDNWCDCCGPCCTTDCWVDYPCQCSHGNCYLTEDGSWVSNDACCDVSGVRLVQSNSALRFGWWGTASSGSPVKVGEFQDLKPSPFWNVDAISSDGVRTWDMSLSQLDGEAYDARTRYYGPNASARIDFEQYLRRLDHDLLAGYDLDNPAPPTAADKVVTDDLNVGQEYAIRVQELDARFKGRISDNLKWKLNLWGQRKFGERQANAPAHCFDLNANGGGAANNKCHVLSQGQTIDWLTMEIQPVLEAQFENVTFEYSRTMRSFSQNDEAVSRQYTHFNNFSPNNTTLGPDYNYAIVPENFTQIDRLKIAANLTEENQLYANLYVGNTKNEFRDTHRDMNGYDIRLTNTSLDQVTLTGYASRYVETNQVPTTYFTEPPLAPANTWDQDSLRNPVNYFRTRAGVKGAWQPYAGSYGLSDGTSLTGGYEYYQLDREYATYNLTPTPFTQPNTITNQIEFGPSTRWSRSLDTFIRYKVQFIHVPLVGVSEYSEDEPDVNGAFNSSLPEQVHSVELGGTWTPTDNFMATAQFTIENSWQHSQYSNFDETNYPMVFTVWYAPTQRLSFTTGYAYFSNWIDQDITLGANRGIPADTETTRWNYAGQNHLVSFNTNYAVSDCVQLVGGYEWNRGSNAFRVPTSPHAADGVDWSLLPSLSDVVVETNRVTAGVDWQPYRYMNLYCRYILFDYNDLSSGQDSGITHMALGGASVNW